MKIENYSDDTIERYERVLEILAKRGANLLNHRKHKNNNSKPKWSNGSKQSARNNFIRARNRIAKNLCNLRIKQIRFYTFRHWKATTELHRTNNV